MSQLSKTEVATMNPKEFRSMVRKHEWKDITTEVCQGYGQASLVIVPKDISYEFLLFCNRNPIACPILDITEPGNPHPRLMAPEADLRTDLPKYSVFREGELIGEPEDIIKYWRDDLVGFLLGCGLTLIPLLKCANISWRRYGGYPTNITCRPAGRFHGNMVVGVRSFYSAQEAIRAIQITSRHPLFHGAPIHIGNPDEIGIKNLGKPDSFFAKRPVVESPKPGEIVMCWAGAVTPQRVALQSKIPFMITHNPSHELIIDKLAEELAVI